MATTVLVGRPSMPARMVLLGVLFLACAAAAPDITLVNTSTVVVRHRADVLTSPYVDMRSSTSRPTLQDLGAGGQVFQPTSGTADAPSVYAPATSGTAFQPGVGTAPDAVVHVPEPAVLAAYGLLGLACAGALARPRGGRGLWLAGGFAMVAIAAVLAMPDAVAPAPGGGGSGAVIAVTSTQTGGDARTIPAGRAGASPARPATGRGS